MPRRVLSWVRKALGLPLVRTWVLMHRSQDSQGLESPAAVSFVCVAVGLLRGLSCLLFAWPVDRGCRFRLVATSIEMFEKL